MRYFGYGSNLNTADFARWCRERGLDPSGIREVGPAWLPDHEPVFHYFSAAREGGALSVRARLGSATPGALFDVDEEGWRALDQKEGLKYSRVERWVLRAGRAIRATTYIVTEAHQEGALVAPRGAYLEVVTKGLEDRGLPTRQVVEAAQTLATTAFPRALFVYGTLMRGEERESLLVGHGPRRWVSARASGRLVDLGAYPGMLEGESDVSGELVEFDEPGPVLEQLDRVEGFAGYGVAGSLYRRGLILVDGELAWTYHYLGEPGAVIASGDWRAR